MKHFYSHIIDLGDVHSELHILDLTDKEKNHLILVIESSIHHVVINMILTELPEEYKGRFIEHVSNQKHEDAWSVVKEFLSEPEEKIRHAINKLKSEFIKDIRQVHDTKALAE